MKWTIRKWTQEDYIEAFRRLWSASAEKASRMIFLPKGVSFSEYAEHAELTGATLIEVNGYRCTWASFVDANAFDEAVLRRDGQCGGMDPAEIREIHDALVRDGRAKCGGGAAAEFEIRLISRGESSHEKHRK